MNEWHSWAQRWRDANLITPEQLTAIEHYELATTVATTQTLSPSPPAAPRSLGVGTVVGVIVGLVILLASLTTVIGSLTAKEQIPGIFAIGVLFTALGFLGARRIAALEVLEGPTLVGVLELLGVLGVALVLTSLLREVATSSVVHDDGLLTVAVVALVLNGYLWRGANRPLQLFATAVSAIGAFGGLILALHLTSVTLLWTAFFVFLAVGFDVLRRQGFTPLDLLRELTIIAAFAASVTITSTWLLVGLTAMALVAGWALWNGQVQVNRSLRNLGILFSVVVVVWCDLGNSVRASLVLGWVFALVALIIGQRGLRLGSSRFTPEGLTTAIGALALYAVFSKTVTLLIPGATVLLVFGLALGVVATLLLRASRSRKNDTVVGN